MPFVVKVVFSSFYVRMNHEELGTVIFIRNQADLSTADWRR